MSEISWVEKEVKKSKFSDQRLGERFRIIVRDLTKGFGQSIPLASQDWSNTKAAYRFLSNDKVSEEDILGGHMRASQERFSERKGRVLVLHDTTEFSYHRKRPEEIGYTRECKFIRNRRYKVCGLLMHASLVITPEGLPLGLTAIKFWTRKVFKGSDQLRRKINRTRIPIGEKESIRWIENLQESTKLLGDANRCVHIGDRECDIYEFYSEAQRLKTHYVVRSSVNRTTEGVKLYEAVEGSPSRGNYDITYCNKSGEIVQTTLAIKYQSVYIHPPEGKKKNYSKLKVWIVSAKEVLDSAKERKPLHWKIITNLPVKSFESAIEKIDWYAQRWKIETFFKILKSGCRAEELKLRTAARLTRLISIFCISSWRIFWVTMINRICPTLPAKLAFTATELLLLDKLKPSKIRSPKKTISHYIIKLAQLGGYLNRDRDPPPGNMIIWRGFARLHQINLGFELA